MENNLNKKIKRETFLVEDSCEDLRIDEFVFQNSSVFSTMKSIRKAIKRGDITLDTLLTQPYFRIKKGNQITVYTRHDEKKIFELKLRIIYEDSFLAVIEKPPGFPVNGNRFKTIENSLPFNLQKSNEIDALDYPLPVHRLDAQTGGLLLVAKTRSALSSLAEQFHERIVKKRYRAIIMGKLDGEGIVNEKLDERDSITYYKSVMSVPSLKSNYITLVDLWPETGRMHQLRRHMSSIGYPVLGDSLYGREGEILKGKGLFLWAVEKNFLHPQKGWRMNIRINEANRFETTMKREKRRWLLYNEENSGEFHEK